MVAAAAPVPAVDARLELDVARRSAQTAKAREIRIEQHARRSPEIRDLLDERNAHAAAIGELRRKHADLSAEFERLAAEKAGMQIERDSFKQSLDEQIAGRVADGNTLRDRIAELEKQLAAALKPKPRSG